MYYVQNSIENHLQKEVQHSMCRGFGYNKSQGYKVQGPPNQMPMHPYKTVTCFLVFFFFCNDLYYTDI